MTEVSSLGDLVSFRTGKLNSNAAKPEGTYPFFTCSQETYRTNTYSFDTECVLLAGNNANGTYPIKYFSGRFDAYQRTYVIESRDPKKFLIRYLYYAMQLQLEHLRSISTGAATKFLTLSLLRGIEIRVPATREQRRIASILAAYDDLIENNSRRIAILEEMARRIYEEWFVRFRFPGHEGVRMVESELGLVPEGWGFRALGELVDEVRDSISPEAIGADTPYVGLEHLPRRSIALAEWGNAEDVQSTKLRFRAGDILFGKIRPYFHKVAVAPISGVASTDAIVIRPKCAEGYAMVLSVVSSDAFVAHATQTSNGTKMPRANWKVLERFPVPIPPEDLQLQFAALVTSSVAAISNHVMCNRNLRITRDLLLPKLISGELDVSELPEPETIAA